MKAPIVEIYKLSQKPHPEPNITSIGKPVAKLWPFCISKMTVSRHLGFLKFEGCSIRSADTENQREPNMEWIGCTVCEIFAFKLYCELETGVRGHSRSSKAALFDRAHTTLYLSSIVTTPLNLLPFPRYSRILVENRYPLVFGAPVGGDALSFT